MNILKKNIISIISIISFLFLPLIAFGFFEESTGLKETADKSGYSVQKVFGGADSIETGIGSIIGIILSLVGVLFMVLIVFGGVLWMTAAGNDKQVEKAKNIIFQSIIGLIIILLSYVISVFVISAFTGQSLLD